MYNPFQILGIQATRDKELINEAFNRLRSNHLSDPNLLYELTVAHEDCLLYASAEGEMNLFSDLNAN